VATVMEPRRLVFSAVHRFIPSPHEESAWHWFGYRPIRDAPTYRRAAKSLSRAIAGTDTRRPLAVSACGAPSPQARDAR
jgi:hypothetical protein